MKMFKRSSLMMAIALSGMACANDYSAIVTQNLNKAVLDATTYKTELDKSHAEFKTYVPLLNQWRAFLGTAQKMGILNGALASMPAEERAAFLERLVKDPVTQTHYLKQWMANPALSQRLKLFAGILQLPDLAQIDAGKADKMFEGVSKITNQEQRLGLLYALVISPLLDMQQATVKDGVVEAGRYAEMQYDQRMLSMLGEQKQGMFADVSSDSLKNHQFSTKYTMLSLGYKSDLINDPYLGGKFDYGVYVNQSLHGKISSVGLNQITQRDKAYGLGFYGAYTYAGAKLELLYKMNRHDNQYDNIATIVQKENTIQSSFAHAKALVRSDSLSARMGYQFKDVLDNWSLTPYVSYQSSFIERTDGYTVTGTDFSLRDGRVRAVGLGLATQYHLETLQLEADMLVQRLVNYNRSSYDAGHLKEVTLSSLLDKSITDKKSYHMPSKHALGNAIDYHLGTRVGVSYQVSEHQTLKAGVAYHYYTNSKHKGFSYQIAYRYRF